LKKNNEKYDLIVGFYFLSNSLFLLEISKKMTINVRRKKFQKVKKPENAKKC